MRARPQTASSRNSDVTARRPVPGPFIDKNGVVLKKVITLLVVGFAVYYLLTAPAGAADAVSNAFGAVMDAFSQVGVFVNELVA